MKKVYGMSLLFLLLAVVFSNAHANSSLTIDALAYSLDNMMLLVCAILVVFMQTGFAALESGMSPHNNTLNIMFKNFTDLCIGALLYFFVGYSIMYGSDASGGLGLIGWGGFGVATDLTEKAAAGVLHPQIDWLFQMAFAATAATIVSGAVVGRMKFNSYIYYSIFITALVYPISGFWKWGGGWLDQMGFYDFAGSIVVHGVGGFAALAAAIVIGPRLGIFDKDSKNSKGHSLATAVIGVFILWVGWYGFNGGSQLAFAGEANIHATMTIAVNTTLAAAAGAIVAMLTSSYLAHSKKASLSMLLNGSLAGLVGITANCDSVSNYQALIIGAIAGVIVVLGGLLLKRLKIDDAVGAFPVHGLCGLWGGVATGIFGPYNLGVQVLGSLAIVAWSFVTMFLFFKMLNHFKVLRVSKEEELQGLDFVEHGESEGG